MKKSLFIVLLCVASMNAFAKSPIKNCRSYEEAAEASHKVLQENVNNKVFAQMPKAIKDLKRGRKNDIEFKYQVVPPTKFNKDSIEYNNKGQIKKEAKEFAFEGNLTITDSQNGQSKYVVKGCFIINKESVRKGKEKEIIYREQMSKSVNVDAILVPYFDSEAIDRAKKIVGNYYDQHKEYVNVEIKSVKSCPDGYKVTTSRIYYNDAQKYIGDEGTVTFTVKRADQLKDFQLLEQTEEILTEFDHTPAQTISDVNETPQETETITKDDRTNQEKLEQINVNAFSLNSIALSNDSKEQLDLAAQILLEDKSLEIELLGHTCDLGNEDVNYIFGILRAKEAKKYLISKGVKGNRIYVHSYGAKKPLTPNITSENRALNRRVEIKVIK